MDDIEDYTYDQNGIPTVVDDLTDSCPNTPRNHADGLRSYSQRKASTTTESDRLVNQSFTMREDITDIFDIKGEGFDFKLSYSTQTLTWTPMNPGASRPRSSAKGIKSLFKSASSSNIAISKNSLNFRDILGVKIRRRRRIGQKEGEGFCLGFGILTYEFKGPNVMKDRMIHLEHPSEEVCEKWVTKISEILESFDERPRSVKLFLQPFAGEKDGLSQFHEKILPLFRTADCNVDMTEIQHNEQVKQDLIHLNLLDYDCLICMGGDGTTNKVVNGLLNRSNKDYGIEMKRNINPVPAAIALGIIPTGKTNHIAQSIMGTDDPVTAVLHILFGNRHTVDVCSVYHNEKFQRWAFNSQYGFAGNVLTFMKRYSALGTRCVEAAFLKSLTKSKLRSYECDIEYIPASEILAPVFCTRCVTYCKVCSAENVQTDVVEELDPMTQSGSTSSLIDLANTSDPWRTLKGDFMNVGLFTVAGICDFAPQGLSKYTHLNDGCMDLTVVKNVDRKDFIRFLRRHGNSKNQFDFPFVETFRVKEVRFRPRFPASWNYKDHDFNEIDYEMSKVSRNQINNRSKSMNVINDLDSEDRSSVTSGSWGGRHGNRAESVMTLRALSIDSDASDSEVHESSDSRSNYNVQSQMNLTGPQYRMTFHEKERLRRKKHQRKKDEKRKEREERKMRSVWSVDNEMCLDLELDFKVHRGLLFVCGQGINPSTPAREVKIGCLPGI